MAPKLKVLVKEAAYPEEKKQKLTKSMCNHFQKGRVCEKMSWEDSKNVFFLNLKNVVETLADTWHFFMIIFVVIGGKVE